MDRVEELVAARVWITVIIIISFIADNSYSQSTNNSSGSGENLFITPKLLPQNQDEFQFSIGMERLYYLNSDKLTIPFEVEYGLSDRIELAAELSYSRFGRNEAMGFKNLEFGVLYNIIKNFEPVALSMILALEFPVHGSVEHEEGKQISLNPIIIVGKSLGRALITASIGTELSTSNKSLQFGAALVYPIEFINPVVEILGTTEDRVSITADIGIIYSGLRRYEFGDE